MAVLSEEVEGGRLGSVWIWGVLDSRIRIGPQSEKGGGRSGATRPKQMQSLPELEGEKRMKTGKR